MLNVGKYGRLDIFIRRKRQRVRIGAFKNPVMTNF
jgi:hypothetical protein